MFQPDNILKELKELSPAIADVPRVNVYKVPNDYFSGVSSHALLLAYAEQRRSGNTVDYSQVPVGYFDSLADSIMGHIRLEAGIGIVRSVAAETEDISGIVAGIGKKNVFKVPTHYFAHIEEEINGRLRIETASLTNNSSKESGKLLAIIGNKNVYTIPAGYFENVADAAKEKLHKPAPVVSLYRKKSFVSYAAAAVITGIISLSVIFVLNRNNPVTNAPAQNIAVMSQAMQIIKTNNFDREMESVSDAAIVAFLEDKGQNVEAALVASLADDKNLPEADDYIFNNALDEVLNTLDLNN